MQLNPQQLSGVTYIDGPLLVLAGAGSGKTGVITQKIVYLIEECGYKASQIAAVTFTNKAAREMKERVGQYLDKTKRRGLLVSTFHNLGLKILRSNPKAFGLKNGFSILDAGDALSLLQQLSHRNLSRDKDILNKIQHHISRWKNDALLPNSVQKYTFNNPHEQLAAKLYIEYQAHLRAYNAVDFDDLILLPTLGFSENSELLERWQNKIRYLLVDEYQDTNASQYQLVKLLVGVRQQFTVVGDDDQSIYAWRGAKAENLNLLKRDYPRLKLIKLEQNYRSSVCILDAANALIANNPHVYEKKLWSQLGFGELIRVLVTSDEYEEAEQVACELIAHKLKHNTNFKQYAVLYRGNHQARLFERVFRERGIPYKLSGGQSFFSKTEIKDVFSYLRLICNPDDDCAFLRIVNVPKRGIGKSSVEKLSHYAGERGLSLVKAAQEIGLSLLLSVKAHESLTRFIQWFNELRANVHHQDKVLELLKEMVEDIGYEGYLFEQYEEPKQAERRLENVFSLFSWIDSIMYKNKESPLALDEVISKLILLDVLERSDEDSADAVSLSTLHASKGLEYPYVYLVGMEEELLPHRNSIEEENIEEERRLCYVGITRAQKALTISFAKRRRRFGDISDCEPSRFLAELPEKLLEHSGLDSKPPSEKKAQACLKDLRAMLAK
jgi:ATP-dependent DNA helicase Rep